MFYKHIVHNVFIFKYRYCKDIWMLISGLKKEIKNMVIDRLHKIIFPYSFVIPISKF